MAPFAVRWNTGMTVATVLLLVGAALLVASPEGAPLHTAGFGIVIVAAVFYLGVRVVMLVKDSRRTP